MPIEITRWHLRNLFDSATLERGIALARRNAVLHPEVHRDGRLVTALVQGPGRRPYRVLAQVSHPPSGAISVHGSCSCPARYNCQHVAAALWSVAPEGEETGPGASPLPAEVETWLAELAKAGGPEPGGPRQDEALLYVVGLGHSRTGALAPTVDALVLGGRKDGRQGPPRRLPLSPEVLASRFDAEDLRVAVLVAAAHGSGSGALTGPIAAEALRAVLVTGRARLEVADGPPLRLGEPRRGTVRWEAAADGQQRLAFILEGEPVLLDLGEPWYLDLATAQCGPVETGLPKALVAPLLSAPALTPVAAAAVAERLASVPALAPLPKPRGLPIQELPRQRPLPCITLQSVAIGHAGARDDRDAWDHHLRLSFDYGGHRIPAGARENPLHVSTGEHLVRIVRDLKAEGAATERLEGLGLIPGIWTDEAPDLFFPEGDISHWVELLTVALPALAREGWRVEEAPGFRLHPVEADDWYAEVSDGGAWFDLELGVEIDGRRLPVVPLVVQLVAQLGRHRDGDPLAETAKDSAWYVTLPEGGFLRLPAERVRTILGTLLELYDPGSVRKQAVRLPRLAAHRLADLDALAPGGVRWRGAEALQALGERLRGFGGVARVPDPPGLQATLRDYQRDGLAWLQFLREFELGGTLADDMGLGKTVQTLAHVLTEKSAGRLDRPALVVAPTSLVVNWRREAERFAPDLRVLVLHGPERKARFAEIPTHDLILTTYPLLPRDLEALAGHEYHLLIFDEAQNIKNPKAKASGAARKLPARHRLCLTGTPMENHLGELWALFDLLLPGLLGDETRFRRTVRTPIEQHGDEARRAALARRIAPFLLRRTKAQVVRELPPKTEITRTVALGPHQRDLYESVRAAMHEKVRQAIARRGLARSRIEVLEALLRLRQICCDPRLLEGDAGGTRRESAKLELLLEMLPELVEEGRRILLFSQFTQMIALIEPELDRLGLAYVKLTGQTRDRATPVDRFQAGEVPIFVVSLKAGGTGLNLTAADTVIHYDPWWNPAVERQATDRAHRIGQDKPVFAYKLLTEGTVEEKIAELQARKAALADALFGEGKGGAAALSAEDLEGLFEPL